MAAASRSASEREAAGVGSGLRIARESPDQPAVRRLLDRLDEYLASLYPPEANHILGLQALAAPEVTFLVARDGGEVVGTAAARRCAGEAATGGQPYGEVKRMMVEPARRGRRIGARLLQSLEDELQRQGLALALLETGAEQHAAVRLYERAGYRRRGPFGGYPDNGLSVFYGKGLGGGP